MQVVQVVQVVQAVQDRAFVVGEDGKVAALSGGGEVGQGDPPFSLGVGDAAGGVGVELNLKS